MYIVRVIWGKDIFKRPVFAREFERGNAQAKIHCKFPIIYCVYGVNNLLDLIKLVPDAKVFLIDENPAPFANKYNTWYHKVYALKKAQEKYEDILYLDFDAYFINNFDSKSYTKFINKNVLFPWHTNKRISVTWGGRQRRALGYIRRIAYCCFFYTNESQILSEWLQAYDEMPYLTDEQALTYAVEKKYGAISTEELHQLYEPAFIQTNKQYNKNFDDVCLLHYVSESKWIRRNKPKPQSIPQALTKEIVVARYKEDIEWVYKLPKDYKVTVYNKFKGENLLPNVGKDQHTHLYHIISNYDKLADITIFTQGNPTDHIRRKWLVPWITRDFDVFEGIHERDDYFPENITYDSLKKHPLNMNILWKYTFGLEYEKKKYPISFNGIFKVKKSAILQYPKSFYEKLFSLVDKERDPIEAHYVERLWRILFTSHP